MSLSSHILRYELSHRICRLLLHLGRDVSEGAERESCAEVAQHAGERLDIHVVLQGNRDEYVSQIVEPYMIQPRAFQNPLMETVYSIRIPHPAVHRRLEHDGVIRMLFMLRYKKVNDLL